MLMEDSVYTNQPSSYFPHRWLLAELLRRQPSSHPERKEFKGLAWNAAFQDWWSRPIE